MSASDPNNLEGDPPTREERAAMARELDRVAPTPAHKFALMFGAAKAIEADTKKVHPWTPKKSHCHEMPETP